MNQPLLRFLITNNYKNLSLDKIVELQNLNIFIGANNSGKSNFINCLKFLKDSLTKTPEKNRGVSSFEDAIAQIGGHRILDITVKSPAQVRLAYCFNFPQNQDSTILDLKFLVNQQKLKVSIAQESLYTGLKLDNVNSIPDFYYYKFHHKESGKGEIAISNQEDSNEEKLTQKFQRINDIPINSLGLSLIPELLESSLVNTPVYQIRRDLIECIYNWQFYNANNMDVHKIRIAEPKIGGRDIYLSASGENLALVLENLIQEDIDFEDSINRALKAILPKTRRFRPLRSGRLSLNLEWYFENIKEPLYLDELSDVTVRMLCWATILHSPILPSLLVIDEPELGLHISWMPILAEWIKSAARKTQVIITTHSPDLLDHFTDCLENVFCFYSEDKMHFSMKTLSREMLSPKLAEGWELGDLYRTEIHL
jgi:predicted ATPase